MRAYAQLYVFFAPSAPMERAIQCARECRKWICSSIRIGVQKWIISLCNADEIISFPLNKRLNL